MPKGLFWKFRLYRKL
ncbi:hypothetical protein PENSTE_c001G04749 [Penicillium steckii]|uniref:Uncharacterized protein n=1 Tax=Penicillium steckii TaxID=303698 RepID=A0A1V6U0G0_9EURO|nr:hypothetical protein PENSTE_c001G04749 [Penicillium steckii]